jgi:hypothetical protein
MPDISPVKPDYSQAWVRGWEYISQEGTSFWTGLREAHGYTRDHINELADGTLPPPVQELFECDWGPSLPELDDLITLATVYGCKPGELLDRCFEEKGRILIAEEEAAAKVTIQVVVTNYRVENNEIRESTWVEERPFKVKESATREGEFWLYLGDGPQSMPVDKIPHAIEHGGWWAQAGTKPVFVDGVWGGRNYPAMFVAADELYRIYRLIQDGERGEV